MWLDAGHDLGNHTYSHRSLNTRPLEELEQDVVRGEPVTRALLAEKGGTLRYFRHPFLQVGLDLDKRHAFETFLAGRGYTVAPVTIDNDDYIYAFAYADALRRGDQETAARLASDLGDLLAPSLGADRRPEALAVTRSAGLGDQGLRGPHAVTNASVPHTLRADYSRRDRG
jgi:peptidoglycan/xylan/chitin deacetylase (PgdA/CDA1 family)